jgi:hypothetical protein
MQNGSLCGASKLYFELLLEHVRGHILVGGDAVSRDDYRECVKLGIPVFYVKAELAVKDSPQDCVAGRLPTSRLPLGSVSEELFGKFGAIDAYHKLYHGTVTQSCVRSSNMTMSSLPPPPIAPPPPSSSSMEVRP